MKTVKAIGVLLVITANTNAQPRPQLIESSAPVWTTTTAWRVEPQPQVTLGADATVFSVVSGAHRYADGRIVVADEKAKELLMFDARGKFVRKIARTGSGPGEFQAIGNMMSAGGDSIAIWDYRTRRMSYFGAQGEFIRSGAKPAPIENTLANGMKTLTYPNPIGRFADGTLLAQRRGRSEQRKVSNMTVDSVNYVIMSETSAHEIGKFFNEEQWEYFHPSGDISFGDGPFGRTGSVVTGPESFFYSDGIQFTITEFNKSGTPIRVMSIRRAASPVTAALIAEHKKTAFEEWHGARKTTLMNWMPFPKNLPAFKGLVRDASGRIWAGNYDANSLRSRYDVFEPGGRWLGTVQMPEGIELLETGAGWVLLRVLSADGEPLVQLHRLVQPS